MSLFDKNKFISFILDNDVVGFFREPIVLKSGRKSNWYVNWRSVSSDVFLIDQLSNFLMSFVTDLKIHHEGFYGVPEGATKLAIISTFKWAQKQPSYDVGSHALSMGRGKPKEHGDAKDRYFLGGPKGKLVVIEDVTTTGRSLIDTIKILREAGANVAAAISLTDRMELTEGKKTVAQVIAEHGVEFHAMSKASEILPEACRRLKPDAGIIAAIEEEYKQFGIAPIKLEKR
jgi:orotate phosphoribosyltransferase